MTGTSSDRVSGFRLAILAQTSVLDADGSPGDPPYREALSLDSLQFRAVSTSVGRLATSCIRHYVGCFSSLTTTVGVELCEVMG
jgi:hypothetical protein